MALKSLKWICGYAAQERCWELANRVCLIWHWPASVTMGLCSMKRVKQLKPFSIPIQPWRSINTWRSVWKPSAAA